MLRRLLAGWSAAIAAVTLAACSGGGGTTTATSEGARVYADSGCGSCHAFGPAGSAGTAGPSLDDSQMTPAQAAAVIRRGAAGMPAYADGLSATQIEALARFVTGR